MMGVSDCTHTNLLPLIMHMQFLMGSGRSQSDETPGLFLLLQSLLKLHRHHACLQSAVHAFLLLLQAESYEGTELWSVVIREVVTSIDSCLADGKEDLLNICDAKLLKRLTTCVLKTMDVVCGMNQLHSMPTCLLWKIFYVLISRYIAILHLRNIVCLNVHVKVQVIVIPSMCNVIVNGNWPT